MWSSFCFAFKADNIVFLFKFYAKLILLKGIFLVEKLREKGLK